MREPFASTVDLNSGIVDPVSRIIQRWLSDMVGVYADTDATKRIFEEEGDRLIYEVYLAKFPEVEGDLTHSTTVIYPGCVGEEFHMTRGHYHLKPNLGEVYLGLSGNGCLLLQAVSGLVRRVDMRRGTIAHTPPSWGHRTLNTGIEPFVFLDVYPCGLGTDYTAMEKRGFAELVVSRKGEVTLIENPRYLRTVQ